MEEKITYSYGDKNEKNANEFKVQIILKDCELERASQPVKGGYIKSLGYGYNNESALTVAKKFLIDSGKNCNFSLPASNVQNALSQHPCSAVEFESVWANSASNIIGILSPELKKIMRALSVVRGASPNIILYHVEPINGGENTLFFKSDIYRGIHGGGFADNPLTDFISDFENAAAKDGWIDLALNLYADVKREEVRHHKLFKAWSIIESRAKIKISKSSIVVNDEIGNPIPYKDGNLMLKHDVGRALYYIREKVYQNLNRIDSRPFSLTKRILSAYIIRNIVAHEGGADLADRKSTKANEIDALQFYGQSHGMQGIGALEVEDWARDLIEFEIRQHR